MFSSLHYTCHCLYLSITINCFSLHISTLLYKKHLVTSFVHVLFIYPTCFCSQSSIVDTATRLQTGPSGVLIPRKDEIFFLQNLQTNCRALSQEAEQQGCDTDHTPPSHAKVNNEWRLYPYSPYTHSQHAMGL